MLGASPLPSIPGYTGISTPPPQDGGTRGGCALYVRRDLPSSFVTFRTPLQVLAVQLHLDRLYTAVSMYIPPSEDLASDDFRGLIRQLPTPFIILGDLNGRHPLWGDTTINPRGRLLASLVEDLELGVLNTGEFTHFQIQTGTFSVLDLALCSPEVHADLEWEVADDLHGSDHFPTIVTVANSPPRPYVPRWKLDKANWSEFQELTERLLTAGEFHSADEVVGYFTSSVLTAGHMTIPRTSGLPRRKPLPWWTAECATALRDKRQAYKLYKRHPCEYLRVQYRKANARLRFVQKQARRTSWQSFVGSLSSQTPLQEVWKRVKKMRGKFSPDPLPILNVGGSISNPKDVADVMAAAFSDISSRDQTQSASFRSHRTASEGSPLDFSSVGGEVYNVPFSMRELRCALSSCTDTAPGPDEIPYAMIRHLGAKGLAFLLDLFNRLWIASCLPETWKIATVLAFRKPGKDHSVPQGFRPIALTSCLCKLFEKMVNVRLTWFLEQGGHLSQSQCGFRRLHSTSDALIRLESSVCSAFAEKQHFVTVFFDMEKAYDTVWKYGIMKALHSFGLRGRLPLLLRTFLTGRLFRVRVGNSLSRLVPQEEGVPQGSVLSVTLFAVGINGITSVVPPDVLSTLYVDDFTVSFGATRMALVERRLQRTLDRVSAWADIHGFRFSPGKTKVVHFCRLRGVHPDPDLYLNGRRLDVVEEHRFLGLVFDHRLTWESHIRSLKTSCVKALQVIRTCSHTSWGADRSTLLTLYRSLVKSKLDYGCEVYSSASGRFLKMLDSIHHAGVRLATGAFRSSPIPSLLCDAEEMPLGLHRSTITLRCYSRIQRIHQSTTGRVAVDTSKDLVFLARSQIPQPFGFRCRTLLQEFSVSLGPVAPVVCPSVPPWTVPDVVFCHYVSPYRDSAPEQCLRSVFLDHRDAAHSTAYAVYTDGSKSNRGVGYSAVSNDWTDGGSLPGTASIFSAELLAIKTALQSILDKEAQRKEIVIFSDSRAALEALKGLCPSHPFVSSVLKLISRAADSGLSIRLCWVPAHCGVEGNEKADREAKAASVSHLRDRDIPLPFGDYVPILKSATRSAWQTTWEGLGGNKMRAIAPSLRPWSYPPMPRRSETALCRLRVGHTLLTHGHLMEGRAPPSCEDCLVPLTVRHLLTECPSLGNLRSRHLYKCRDRDGRYRLSLVLGEESCRPGGGTLRFLEETSLLHRL